MQAPSSTSAPTIRPGRFPAPAPHPAERTGRSLLVAVRQVVAQDLEGRVVAMLRGVERTPAVLEELRHHRAEDPRGGRIAVRDVETGDLVVPFVLEAGRSGHARVDGRGGVTPFREQADRR